MGNFIIIFLLNLQLMPLDSIKPKMKGYGLSTFSGIFPDTFECEIIDIIIRPKRNLIIAKLSKQNLEHSGVVAGMSGSPVFINNKLIGAVAYAWEFQKEPICGITPIYEMLYPESFPKTRNLPIRNFSLPIALSANLSENEMELLKKIFSQNIKPIFLPMGKGQEESSEIKPLLGVAVGGSLVDGDLKIAAIGTLTYLKKDTIYAFGHPFFNFGEVEFPLILGKIHCVMSAYDISFKLFSPIKEIGIINYDYQTAIKGLLNKKARKIPLTIKITDAQKNEEYHYQLANHYKLIPILLPICLSYSISSFYPKDLLEYTIKNHVKIKLLLKDKNLEKTWEFEKFMVNNEEKSWGLFDFSSELNEILENPFEKIEVLDCEIESKVWQKKKEAQIVDIILNKTILKPNDELKLTIILQDNYGKIFYVKNNLKINFSPGDYFLFIGNPEDAGFLTPKKERKSFNSLITDLGKRKRGNVLKLIIYSQKKGVFLKNYPHLLPLSLVKLKEKNNEEFSQFVLHWEREEILDFFLSNSKTIPIKIKEEE